MRSSLKASIDDDVKPESSVYEDSGLVFATRTGGVVSPEKLVKRSFKPLLKTARLPETTRFHDLRHTCATLAMADGVHAKVVQERLGHSTISITLDRYSHVTASMQHDASDRLERLLGS